MRDAREIVSHQVDDHEVLCTVLRTLGQRLAKRGIVFGTGAARTRALDRPGFDVTGAVDLQKPLGGRTQPTSRPGNPRKRRMGQRFELGDGDRRPTATREAALRNAARG